ncbi:unnamed protein product [Phyllotreta striolata]|uniref:Phosphatidate cytidylyltransferase, mitochondrial n=1 Tax=Phyllotreta striolata TaxID=444603 RepID=A0A9N9TRG0_PHYSR|nr:unnamed protein product [Phyllotreta striolata]
MATKLKALSPIYAQILSKFPKDITFCFAYGSGVKKQLQNVNQNMLDLIFCVDNPVLWHQINLSANRSHYSGLKYLGHNFISHYQDHFGAKVYYNTLVPLQGMYIKYGTISTKNLITDLLEWSDLYLAGRLHKPVKIIERANSPELNTALQLNLQSAVHAALLILPETFTEYEFYHTICNLSYSGDFRMIFGENKNKVDNIIKPQVLSFRKLYSPFINHLQDFVEIPIPISKQITKQEVVETVKPPSNNHYKKSPLPEIELVDVVQCRQDFSPTARLHHLNQLPRWPQKALTRFWNKGTFKQDTEDVLRAIAYDPECGQIVKMCIDNIVWKSSIKQSVKGILTAGIFKSVKYSSRKIRKMFY